LSDPAPGPRRRRRWPWVVGAIALVALVVGVAWPPARVTFQTLALVPSLVEIGPQPLAFAPEPNHVEVTYTAPDDEELPADLWLPASASAEAPVGAVVFVSGINDQGRTHPALARIAAAMARTGAAVYVPELPIFFDTRVDATEVGRIVAAFEAVSDRPEVDPEKVGIMGISVGGSLSLIAAADPAIAERVAWVGSFGAFADAEELIADVVSHQYRDGNAIRDWEPALLVRQIVFGLVTEQVADGRDHAYLYGAYDELNNEGVHPFPDADLPLTSATGRDVERLLLVDTLPDAEAVLDSVPDASLALLDGISPIRHVDGIQARVYLMHDHGDRHIPYPNVVSLHDALTDAGVDVRLGEFRLFDHVQPDTRDLGKAIPELWTLFWYLREVATQVL
jgi:dienelactone hydrolase